MEFIYPQFLYALALIAIPILIHLFNFRKFKTVPFSNVTFLKSVKEKTKSQSQLKHLLILFSRILTIAFIVLAFSQPYISFDENQTKTGKQAVSIFVDNSFSMDGENESGRLLQSAIQKAQSIVESYSANTDFYIINNTLQSKHQRKQGKEEALNSLNGISSTPFTPKLSQVFNRQKQALEKSEAEQKDLYLISDFQESIFDINLKDEDSLLSIRLLPLNAYQYNNVFVDSCWLNTPNPRQQSNLTLYARLKSSMAEEKEVSISLEIDGQQLAIANSKFINETIIELNFSCENTGWYNGKLNVQDYPITFDDELFFSFEIKDQIEVCHVYDNSPHVSLKQLFEKDATFNYTTQNISQLNFDQLQNSALLILDGIKELSSGLQQSIRSGLNKGQSILIFPSEEINLESYKQFCAAFSIDYYESLIDESVNINLIVLEHNLFQGVFEKTSDRMSFPEIERFFSISQLNNTNANPIVLFDNKRSFLNEYAISNGKLYLSSVGLDDSFSNLSKHALFVPLTYNIASYSGGSQRLFYSIGQDKIPFNGSSFSYPLKLKKDNFEYIPNSSKSNLFLDDQLIEAGHYAIYDNENTLCGQLAFNFNRLESQLQMVESSTLKQLSQRHENIILLDELPERLDQYLQQLNTGWPLWIYAIIAALLFLFIETLLLRLL